MTGGQAKGRRVRRYILDHVEKSSSNVAQVAGERFGISRQAVNRHLRRLCDDGVLERCGNTRATKYRLAALSRWSGSYAIEPESAEDVIWAREVRGVLGKLPESALAIWHYGFTEIFNNAVDHSEGVTITVDVVRTVVNTEMAITDDGFGIFKKIQAAFELLDERHAVLELSKGKLTTNPRNHTGEGIFFTSRMFDSFQILSGGVCFSHDFGEMEDWILETDGKSVGTTVSMRLRNDATRTAREVFNEFASGDDFGFTKTVVPVRMVPYGEDQLISRSQAKRLLARVDLFRTVFFDFQEVGAIGPAFADEIFRVFALRHPDIELMAINANPGIKKTIQRAQANLDHFQRTNRVGGGRS